MTQLFIFSSDLKFLDVKAQAYIEVPVKNNFFATELEKQRKLFLGKYYHFTILSPITAT